MERRLTPTAMALLLLALVACRAGGPDATASGPDVIYHNGTIVTANETHDVVEAVAVRDGRIVAVGSEEDVRARATGATREVDLEGATMLPGFFDNHVHASGRGGSLMEWKGGMISEVPEWLRDVTTNEALYDALRTHAETLGPGEWVLGSLSREIWPNQTLPDRRDLDAVVPDRPVYLTRGPHTSIMNSRVLELAGITRDTEFIGGGEVGKDESGEPDGRLYDAARRLVADVLPDGDDDGVVAVEEQMENLRHRMLEFASMGVTSVNVASVRPRQLRLFQATYDRYGEELPRATLQLRLSPGYDTWDDLDEGVRASIEEMESLGFVTGFGNDRLRLGAIKMSIDGGLSAPVFWSLEPYENRPDFQGVIRIPAEAFYPVARRAHELGWQLGIHTMGDGAVTMVVDELERILTEAPREGHRHYLHHVAVKPSQETIEKMARLDLGVASQPAFTVGLGSYAVEALAGDREETMNPTKSLLDAGVWVSWGSDGAPHGPRVSLWTGITRRGWDDAVYGPEEAVSRQEAIRLHTWAPAYQTFSEDVTGSIEVGKYADFVVLGENVLTIEEDRIRYVPVLRTIVENREIWSAG
ncbi:MAG: amidohydrolase [Longimicrobiales bacterium]|nr:amidohydrolase [Longimicrobiales bacterium]